MFIFDNNLNQLVLVFGTAHHNYQTTRLASNDIRFLWWQWQWSFHSSTLTVTTAQTQRYWRTMLTWYPTKQRNKQNNCKMQFTVEHAVNCFISLSTENY